MSQGPAVPRSSLAFFARRARRAPQPLLPPLDTVLAASTIFNDGEQRASGTSGKNGTFAVAITVCSTDSKKI